MKKKTLALLVIALFFIGCSKDDPEPKSCNCGSIESQGFNSWATPGYSKYIRNDCSGIIKMFYFRLGVGHQLETDIVFLRDLLGKNWA